MSMGIKLYGLDVLFMSITHLAVCNPAFDELSTVPQYAAVRGLLVRSSF